MAKRQPKITTTAENVLTVDCLCGGDEMQFTGEPTLKGFHKFFCETCHSTLWLSPSGFRSADGAKKIMER